MNNQSAKPPASGDGSDSLLRELLDEVKLLRKDMNTGVVNHERLNGDVRTLDQRLTRQEQDQRETERLTTLNVTTLATMQARAEEAEKSAVAAKAATDNRIKLLMLIIAAATLLNALISTAHK